MVSIIIPFKYDVWRLRLLMASVKTMPSEDVEICIVEVGQSQHVNPDDINHEAQIKYKFVWTDRLFNRGWVMNIGVKHLSEGEILALSDADLIFTPEWSVLLYEAKSPVVAWSRIHVLDEVATEEYLRSGVLGRPLRTWQPSVTGACGGVSIVPREVFYQTGGMVECFEGWGGGDNAAWARLAAFGYPFKHFDCDLWHMWHPLRAPVGRKRWDAYRMLIWAKEHWLQYMEGGWGDLAGPNTDFETIHSDSNDPSVHNYLGALLARQGEWNEALSEFKKALAIDPNDATTHYSLGTAYMQIGMVDECIVEYRRALKIDSKLAMAHNNLAIAYFQKGNYKKAVKHCDNAVRLGLRVHPQFLEALMHHRPRIPGSVDHN
jgi:hypothetical protein